MIRIPPHSEIAAGAVKRRYEQEMTDAKGSLPPTAQIWPSFAADFDGKTRTELQIAGRSIERMTKGPGDKGSGQPLSRRFDLVILAPGVRK